MGVTDNGQQLVFILLYMEPGCMLSRKPGYMSTVTPDHMKQLH